MLQISYTCLSVVSSVGSKPLFENVGSKITSNIILITSGLSLGGAIVSALVLELPPMPHAACR